MLGGRIATNFYSFLNNAVKMHDLPLGSKLLFHLFIFRTMQMGVVRHKVKKGRNQGIWHFCTDMFIYPGKVGVPSIAPPLFFFYLLQTRNFTKVIHIVSYTQHTPLFFLKSFIVYLPASKSLAKDMAK